MTAPSILDLEKRIKILEEELTTCRLAEEALRESREFCSRLVDTIPDVIVRTDLEGNIVFVNHYTLQISGYGRQEVEGKSILLFASPGDQDRFLLRRWHK